jgi:NADH dehydrogenase
VEPDLSVPGHPEISVIGDLAAVPGERPVPGIAPAAKQMGRHAAANVILALQSKPTRPFRYRDYGQLATIGRSAAVAIMGPLKLSGFIAWAVWLVAHIYFLINFRNRLVVLIDWASSYFTHNRYARIVTKKLS